MCLSTQELKKKKKKQRVNLEPPRPMAARLKKKKTTCKPRTASAYGRAVNKENSMHNIVCVLLFQQRLANTHHKLRDSKSS